MQNMKKSSTKRLDQAAKKYYWLTGAFLNFDKGKRYRCVGTQNNYVSVVPVQFDLTNHELKEKLAQKILQNVEKIASLLVLLSA